MWKNMTFDKHAKYRKYGFQRHFAPWCRTRQGKTQHDFPEKNKAKRFRSGVNYVKAGDSRPEEEGSSVRNFQCFKINDDVIIYGIGGVPLTTLIDS